MILDNGDHTRNADVVFWAGWWHWAASLKKRENVICIFDVFPWPLLFGDDRRINTGHDFLSFSDWKVPEQEGYGVQQWNGRGCKWGSSADCYIQSKSNQLQPSSIKYVFSELSHHTIGIIISIKVTKASCTWWKLPERVAWLDRNQHLLVSP